MKTSYTIFVINLAVAVIIAFITSATDSLPFFGMFGIISLIIAVADLLIGVILYWARKDEIAKGFLLTSGILFLLGFCICGTMWAGYK